MELIINTTNIKSSGSTQVAVSFIIECKEIKNHKYHVFLSETVKEEIKQITFPSNFIFYNFDSKPFFTIKGIKTWNKLLRFEKKIKPDCVFTVFGPNIWKPKSPHLQGYGHGYYVYPESPIFKMMKIKRLLLIKAYKKVHTYFFKRGGDYFVCETKSVENRLVKLFNNNNKTIFTVSNTYNTYYNNYKTKENKYLPNKTINEYRFITLSSFTLNKNIKILNHVIPLLKQKEDGVKIVFVISVDQITVNNNFSEKVKDRIIAIGKIKVELGPQIYSECDALFLPTLIECFSASYAESMKMKKPIITSNLPFAKAVCGNAAIYFNPIEPIDIAEKILKLINDKELQKKLVSNGEKRLLSFETPKSRTEKYLQICEKIATG